jgi:hypothetical protein
MASAVPEAAVTRPARRLPLKMSAALAARDPAAAIETQFIGQARCARGVGSGELAGLESGTTTILSPFYFEICGSVSRVSRQAGDAAQVFRIL